jgi:hypothetical protein
MSNCPRGLNGGGGNSPNGVGNVPAATPAGSGSGDNERSYLYNAYPPTSPAQLSTKQAILAEVTSGLGFFPDALIYGTPKGYIQPYYPLNPLKPPMVGVNGGMVDVEGRELAKISLSMPFRLKSTTRLELGAGAESPVCLTSPAKVVAVSSSREIVVSLNGSPLPAAKSVVYFCFNPGITTLSVATTTEPAEVAIYLFT